MDITLQESTLAELNQKIDLLTTQVAYLSEQAQQVERQRMERAELVRDITPLANQAFSLAVEQLEEVQEYIDLDDLLRLFKRLLRNGRNLEKILDQLESTADLIETLGPLSDEAFVKVVDMLAALEAKGYFTLARGGMNMLDKTVAAVNPAELDRLGENIPLLLNLVREITQADVLAVANDTLIEVKQELAKPSNASLAGLFKQLRDPATLRGLSIMVRAMQVIGKQASTEPRRQ